MLSLGTVSIGPRQIDRRGWTLIAIGVTAIVGVGVAMTRVRYDIWGGVVAIPLLAIAVVTWVDRTLGECGRQVVRICQWGFGVKIVGTIARYWVSFDAYRGFSDAARYHDNGRIIAASARSGSLPLSSLVPHTQGTAFIDELTGLLYTFVGGSRLLGFLLFTTFGYVGVVLMIKAAATAVRALRLPRYALLCTLAPSLVFWPSSIGKEAWMSWTLGLLLLGAARLYQRRGISAVVTIGAGAALAAMVRPHYAAIWLGGVVCGGLVAAVAGRRAGRRGWPSLVAWCVLGLAAVFVVGRVTLAYLDPTSDEPSVETAGEQVSEIFTESTRRSSTGGSAINPIEPRSPSAFPMAIARTLSRPLLIEARSLPTLLPALETTAFLVLIALSWRSIIGGWRLVLGNPLLMCAAAIIVVWALVFCRLGNLAILVRQRSLIVPAALLFVCLPVRRRAR